MRGIFANTLFSCAPFRTSLSPGYYVSPGLCTKLTLSPLTTMLCQNMLFFITKIHFSPQIFLVRVFGWDFPYKYSYLVSLGTSLTKTICIFVDPLFVGPFLFNWLSWNRFNLMVCILLVHLGFHFFLIIIIIIIIIIVIIK